MGRHFSFSALLISFQISNLQWLLFFQMIFSIHSTMRMQWCELKILGEVTHLDVQNQKIRLDLLLFARCSLNLNILGKKF